MKRVEEAVEAARSAASGCLPPRVLGCRRGKDSVMGGGDVLVETAEGVTTVTLSSPARRNAIESAIWEKLAG